MLLTSLGGVDLGDDGPFPSFQDRQRFPPRVDNRRLADVLGPVLGADPICRHDEHAVLHGPRREQDFRDGFRAPGPVGRNDQDLGAFQCKTTCALGEPQVVANLHSESADLGVENRKAITGSDKPVHSETGKMGFPVLRDFAVGGHKNRGIPHPVLFPFQHPDDDATTPGERYR